MARKKILLVDDSNTALMMEQMILKAEPYDLVTAHDGMDAVAKAKSERPDLILMDVMMPRLDGFGAVRQLREDEATRDVPIIMVTTRAEMENIQTGYQSGCNDYLTKPINGLELREKVRDLLGK